jgi:hypothetical protein
MEEKDVCCIDNSIFLYAQPLGQFPAISGHYQICNSLNIKNNNL